MSIEHLNEFELIARIIDQLGDATAQEILVPPGDDAAVWKNAADFTVASVDSLAEGTHWRRDTMSLADVGWRTVVTSLSDLAAMGVDTGTLLIAAQLGPDVTIDDLDAFISGLAEACRCFDTRIAGGNIVRAASTSFSATAIGNTPTGDKLLRRDTAKSGDAVAVSGTPGASAAGLTLIETARTYGPQAAPLLAAHRRPQARLVLGHAAVAAGLRCAIDISDGLAQDLEHVAKASKVGIEINIEKLPMHPAATTLLGNDRALALALGGGEDYELALCGPTDSLDTLGTTKHSVLPLTRIGQVVAEHPGEVLILESSGQPMKIKIRGWDQLH